MLNKINPYWPNNTTYFLTGSTFLHYPYFKEDEQKQILLNQIGKVEERLKISISLFSISINHYHLKFHLKNGLYLAKIKQLLHGGTTYEYRKRFIMKYKEMWQSSKVIQVASEEMDWKITGYIAGNLLKHKEVSTLEELATNPFSCYGQLIKRYNKDLINNLIYSVIDVDENAEGQMNVDGLEGTKVPVPAPSAKAG